MDDLNVTPKPNPTVKNYVQPYSSLQFNIIYCNNGTSEYESSPKRPPSLQTFLELQICCGHNMLLL